MKVRLEDIVVASIPDVSGVYCIKNELNNKVYIGVSTNLRKRIIKHLSLLRRSKHHNIYLQSAYNIYGSSSLTLEILETHTKIKDSELLKREHYYQELYKSTDRRFGYNLMSTDLSGKLRHNPLYREHMSRIMSGVPKSEQHRQSISRSLKGRRGTPHSLEFKEYISKCLKGRPKSQEHREKISAAKKGVPSPLKGVKLGATHSEEARRKLSLSKRGEFNPRSVKIVDDKGNVYLTIKEACEKLNLCRTTINKRIKNGTFRRI